jgi:hypothetical protein
MLTAVGFVILLLGLGQLVLPGIAARRLRDRLARSGKVLKVEVDAFPAVELLWHQADKVVVQLASYRSSPGHLGSLLGQAADVGTLDASVTQLDTGLLTLRRAVLHKRGAQLVGSAVVTQADVRAALPIVQGVQLVASGNGALTLRGTATLLGVTAMLDATVGTQSGRLIVQPDVPFGGFATLTLFDDPRVAVQGLSATPTADGFSVTAQARLR